MKKLFPLALVAAMAVLMFIPACGGGGGGGGGGTAVTADYVSTDTPLSIPDSNSSETVPGLVSSYMLVTGAPNPVSKVTLTINITHTYTPDLWIYLISPSSTSVLVSWMNGDLDFDGVGKNYSYTTFDDDAVVYIWQANNPFSGTYIPDNLLSAFNGEDPNGVWTLTVIDDWYFDTGKLKSWGINID